MEKINVLQKKIEERAAKKFNKDFMSLITLINENPNDFTNIEEMKNELIEIYTKEEIEVLADFLENKE